jgi:hypothetical protein
MSVRLPRGDGLSATPAGSRLGGQEDFMNTQLFRIAGPALAISVLFFNCGAEAQPPYVYGAVPYYPAYSGGCYGQGGYASGNGYLYVNPYCNGWGSAYGAGGAFHRGGGGNRGGRHGHGAFGQPGRGEGGRGGISHGGGSHGGGGHGR